VRGIDGPTRADCTVGYLKHRTSGDDYLVVVNRNLTRAGTFDLTLDAPVDVERIDPATGAAVSVARGTRVLHAGPLAPADGALYHLVGTTFEHLPGVREVHRAGTAADYVLARGVLHVDYATGDRHWETATRAPLDAAASITPLGVGRPVSR